MKTIVEEASGSSLTSEGCIRAFERSRLQACCRRVSAAQLLPTLVVSAKYFSLDFKSVWSFFASECLCLADLSAKFPRNSSWTFQRPRDQDSRKAMQCCCTGTYLSNSFSRDPLHVEFIHAAGDSTASLGSGLAQGGSCILSESLNLTQILIENF